MRDGNELFELCKQVYEVTGWKDTHSRIDDSNHTVRNEGNEVLLGTKQVPLYTSDYLLEKLPETYNKQELALWRSGVSSWRAGYSPIESYRDDTPLKALLKLSLKLHEDKLL